MNRLLFTLLAGLSTPFEPWNFKERHMTYPLRSGHFSGVRAARRLARKKRNREKERLHA
jgi:hypothetical protein